MAASAKNFGFMCAFGRFPRMLIHPIVWAHVHVFPSAGSLSALLQTAATSFLLPYESLLVRTGSTAPRSEASLLRCSDDLFFVPLLFFLLLTAESPMRE